MHSSRYLASIVEFVQVIADRKEPLLARLQTLIYQPLLNLWIGEAFTVVLVESWGLVVGCSRGDLSWGCSRREGQLGAACHCIHGRGHAK